MERELAKTFAQKLYAQVDAPLPLEPLLRGCRQSTCDA